MMFKTIEWKNNTVVMLDQRALPAKEVYLTYKNSDEVADAIKTMVIRGAPAIGVAGAMGLALGALEIQAKDVEDFIRQLEKISDKLLKTRPTAVNLQWGLERMKNVLHASRFTNDVSRIQTILITEAQKILDEDIQINRAMGAHGAALINNGDHVLTHCNAGALATAGFGTALGVLYSAWGEGKRFDVYADETRPYLQGARLTAWELQKNGIPTTLITDNMAGWMMKKGLITKVIVGADRIAANGDVANKIGTYSVAILAKHHNIPFYVAAPLSTIDSHTKHGDQIIIEERDTREVTHLLGTPAAGNCIAPEGIKVRNPAFDVTPNELVTGIITEQGIVEAPYISNLAKLFS